MKTKNLTIESLTAWLVCNVRIARNMYAVAINISHGPSRRIERAFWRAKYTHCIEIAKDFGLEHPELKFTPKEIELGAKGD